MKLGNRYLAVLLSAAMIAAACPASVLAEDAGEVADSRVTAETESGTDAETADAEDEPDSGEFYEEAAETPDEDVPDAQENDNAEVSDEGFAQDAGSETAAEETSPQLSEGAREASADGEESLTVKANDSDNEYDYIYVKVNVETTLTVTASRSDVTYAWYRGDLSWNFEETSLGSESSYVVASAEKPEVYKCEVTSGTESATAYFYIYIDNNLYAAADNQNVNVEYGGSATMKVTSVSGEDTTGVTYSWMPLYYNEEGHYNYFGDAIEGAESDEYTVTNVIRAQEYACRVTDKFENSYDVYFTVGVENGLTVTANENNYSSADVAVDPGATTTLTVHVTAKDRDGLTYSWGKYDRNWNWTSLVGMAEESLTTEAINEYTQYQCTVTDKYGNMADAYFYVSVQNNLKVTANENSYGSATIYVDPGATTTLTVHATAKDTGGLTYSWRKHDLQWTNYTSLDNAQTSLTINSVADTAVYECTVADRYGNTVTADFYVYVRNKLEAEGESACVKPGETATLTVHVTANDTDGLTYEWYDSTHSWNRIEGATEASYTTDVIHEYSRYECRVTDKYGNYTYANFQVYPTSEVSVGSNELSLDGSQAVYTFIPEKTAYYTLKTSQTDEQKEDGGRPWLTLYSDASLKNDVDSSEDDDEEWHDSLTDLFEADKTYYLYAGYDQIAFTLNITETTAVATLTFDANGGTFTDESGKKTSKSVAVSSKGDTIAQFSNKIKRPEKPETATEEYYISGWSLTPDGEKLDSDTTFDQDTTVYAVWTKYYKVSLNANGGRFTYWDDEDELVASETYTDENSEGSAVNDLREPYNAPDGFTFAGWSKTPLAKGDISNMLPDDTLIEEGVTYYAVWADAVEVTFDANGGYFNRGKTQQVRTGKYGKNVPLKRASKPRVAPEGKYFAGWGLTAEAIEVIDLSTYTTEEPVTLYAVWADLVTLTYDANGGNFGRNSETGETISQVTRTAMKGYPIEGRQAYFITAPEGKIFVGWATNKDAKPDEALTSDALRSVVADADTTYYAIYDDAVTVTYHVTGDGRYIRYEGDQTYTKITRKGVALTSDTYLAAQSTNTSEEFDYWSTDKEGKNRESLSSYVPTQNVDFYANWKYIILLDANGGYFSTKSETVYRTSATPGGKLDTLPSDTPTSNTAGKVFSGWYLDKACTKPAGNLGSYTASSAATLYAGYGAHTHSWSAWTTKSAATYTSPKVETRRCSVCGETQTRTVGAKLAYVSSLSITATPSLNIAAGKKATLTALVSPANAANKSVTWTSSNTKYATVNANGVVTTKKKGAGKTVTITATAKDGSGQSKSVKIKIKKGKVKKITLKAAKKSVKAGKSVKVKAKVKASKKANKKLKWTSSNTAWATVSGGKVKTTKAGKGHTVTITASATDGTGKKKSVKIKIK